MKTSSLISKRSSKALIALTLAASAPAGAADFHALFEARCLRCHGHAGPFVRERLALDGADVVTRAGRPVAPFLERHAGGLAPEEIALFLRVFARQIEAAGLYDERCGICHDRARELARLRLVLRDGRLVGRYSGHDIATFLQDHARLTPEEAARMTEALAAILEGGR